MTEAQSVVDIADWIAIKTAQFERAAVDHPGLQLINYGTNKSIFMLVKSTDTFYEGVIIGQIPQRERVKPERIGFRVHHRAMRADELPPERRPVDLVDDQVAQILARWDKDQSALGLDFVPCVFGKDGTGKTR